MSIDRIDRILDEWFGPLSAAGAADDKRQRWYKKDAAFDGHLREHFEADVGAALAGTHDDWAETGRGCLALVILLDQMTRNIFRGTAQMYCGDARAIEIAQRAIDRGLDLSLHFVERQFLYMPMMHAEDVATQERCVVAFERLAGEGGPDVVSYAHEHRDIVVRFGRLPHRNDILGRESTDEERKFLQQPGSRF